jgi:uncharacterized protein YcgI (DUF1989 family)
MAEEERLIRPGTACSLELRAGESADIIDVRGHQVADLVAFSLADVDGEWLSPTHTRSSLGRLELRRSDPLLTNFRRMILKLVRDDVGVHDITFASCDRERYLLGYGIDDHPNCREALSRVLLPYGVPIHRIPDPVNLFQNSTVHADGAIETLVPTSRAGDLVSLMATMDTLLAVAACPQDLSPCNGWEPTPIALRGPTGTFRP